MLEFQFQNLLAKKDEAVNEAESNCTRLCLLMKHGVPSVDDRLPSASSSVIAMPSGTSSNKNKIIRAITDEKNDYDFINKMENIISRLKQPYKKIFDEVYLHNVAIKDIYNGKHDGIPNENVYKIIRNGYLKIALLDSDIDFSNTDLIKIDTENYQIKKNKKEIKVEVKALLDDIQAFVVCNKLIFDDDLDFIDNQLCYKTTLKISYLFTIIRQLPNSERLMVVNYMRGNTKTVNKTSDYYTLERALLTIGLLHSEINYGFLNFETDLKISQNKYVKKYLAHLKNFQMTFNI
ncbi:MAG: hypothetical protein RR623_06160 [Bacilli bacterium]